MNHGELIGEAFSIAWRNRFLWFFGLFAGTTVGSLGAPSNSGGTFPAEEGNRSMPSLGTFVGPAREWAAENVLAISLVAGLVLLVILVLVAVGAPCTGALADSVAAIDRGETRRFSSTFRAGLPVFPRTMGLLLIFSALYVFLLLIAGGSVLFLFLLSSSGPLPSQIASVFNALTLAVVLVFVIFIPLGIGGQLAIRDAVAGGERVLASIGNSYHLFRRNLGKALLLWFIQLVAGVMVGITVVIMLLIAGALLGVPAVLLIFAGRSVGIGAIVLAGVVYVSVCVVLLAAINTFNHAYWTLAYLRLVTLSTARLLRRGKMAGRTTRKAENYGKTRR